MKGTRRQVSAALLGALFLWCLPRALQAQFTFTTNNGTLTITGYTGPGGTVVIPDRINDVPVTSIGDYAFMYQTGISEVTISSNVTSIGYTAFYYCTGLTNVIIPDGLAFIADSAFYYCPNLVHVEIPRSVIYIGGIAFGECSSLESIDVDTRNLAYSSSKGVLFNKNQTTLIQYPIGKVGSYAIPNGVSVIAGYAFYSCANLSGITFPNTITSIDPWAFAGCSSIPAFVFPNSLTSIGFSAFDGCGSITDLTLPASITYIANGAFASCGGLVKVTVSASLTSIEDYAFQYCQNLTGIYFLGNAPSCGTSAFANDTNAIAYYLPGTLGWGPTFAGIPTALWTLPYPMILDGPNFWRITNNFGFLISWATNTPVIVDACTNLFNPAWTPVSTNTLTNGTSSFSDPAWTNYPARFYRLRLP
jgi:hypothetical protein